MVLVFENKIRTADFPSNFPADLKSTCFMQIFLRIFTIETKTKIILTFKNYFKEKNSLGLKTKTRILTGTKKLFKPINKYKKY